MTQTPISEIERKFHKDWTAKDCITELRRVVELDPERFISRMTFRNESAISDATWNRYFGTFEEFKRQAGIMLSRHAHRLEKSIAKHASVDNIRRLNGERAAWAGTYTRPSDRRFQTVVVLADIHDKCCCPFWRRVALDTIKRARPEKIILNGDVFDLPEFSKHTRDPREWDVIGRIKWVHRFLEELRRAAPDAEVTFIEGNHEFRLLRHMGEETPALQVVLSDLHGFTVSKLLGLDQFELNYVARADMGAWTERDIAVQLRKNYTMLYDGALLFGHFPEMRNMGIPGASGHHHKHVVWPAYSPTFGPWEWHQTGCGHAREASYCNGEKWANGFLLAHVDTHSRRTAFEYVDTSHPHAMVGGQLYVRSDDEPVLDLAHGRSVYGEATQRTRKAK